MEQTAQNPTTIIQPAKGWIRLDLKEVWDFRELLYFFVWRDLKVRYKQTLLGFSWAIVSPIVQTIIFVLIFSRAAKIATDGVPASVYMMAGLVAWRYFQSTLTASSLSLVNNGAMLTKIYFPRMLVPLSACVTGLVDMGIGLGVTVAWMLWLRILPASTFLLIPVFTAVMFAASFGLSLFFSALNVRYRDVSVLVPFLLQIWMYITVIFSTNWINIKAARLEPMLGFNPGFLWGLNPLISAVEGFRWCLLSSYPTSTIQPPWAALLVGAVPAFLMLMGGLFYFRRVENQFSDIM